MHSNGNRIIYDDPWENELDGCRFCASIEEEDGNLTNITGQADNVTEATWQSVLALRKYFKNQLENK